MQNGPLPSPASSQTAAEIKTAAADLVDRKTKGFTALSMLRQAKVCIQNASLADKNEGLIEAFTEYAKAAHLARKVMAHPEHMNEKNAGQQGLLTREIQEFLGNEGKVLADNFSKIEKKLKQREIISSPSSSSNEDGPITKSGGSIADRVRSLQESTGGAIGTTTKRISLPAVPKTPPSRSPAAPSKPQLPKLDNTSILTPTTAPPPASKVSPLLPSTISNVASPPPPLSAKLPSSPKVDGFNTSSESQPAYARSQAIHPQPQTLRAAPSITALAASLSSSSGPSSHPPSPSVNSFSSLTSHALLPPTSTASAQSQPLSAPIPIPSATSSSTGTATTTGGGLDDDHAFVPASALGPPSPSSTPASSPQSTNFNVNEFKQPSGFNLGRNEVSPPASTSSNINGFAQSSSSAANVQEPTNSSPYHPKQHNSVDINGIAQSTQSSAPPEPQSAGFNLSEFNQAFPDLEDFESQLLQASSSSSSPPAAVSGNAGVGNFTAGEINGGGVALNHLSTMGNGLKPADAGSSSSVRPKASLTKLQNGSAGGSSSLGTEGLASPTVPSFPPSTSAATTSSFQLQQALSPTPLSPPSTSANFTVNAKPPLPTHPNGNGQPPMQVNGHGNPTALPIASGDFSPPSGLSPSTIGVPGPGPSSAAYRPFSASLGRSLDRPSSTPITPSAPAFISRSPSPSHAGGEAEPGRTEGGILADSALNLPVPVQGQMPVQSPPSTQFPSQGQSPNAQGTSSYGSHSSQSPQGANGLPSPLQPQLPPSNLPSSSLPSASTSTRARAQTEVATDTYGANAVPSFSGAGTSSSSSGPTAMGVGNAGNGFASEHRVHTSVDQAFGGHNRTPAESSSSYNASNGPAGGLSRRPAMVNRAPSNTNFSPSPLSPSTSNTPQPNGYGYTGPITYPSVHRRTSTQVLTTNTSPFSNNPFTGPMSPSLAYDPSSPGPLSPPPIAASPSSLNLYRHTTRGAEPSPLLATSTGSSSGLRGSGSSTTTLVEYPSVPRPPPPVAASPLAERQDNRPRQPVFTPTAHVPSLSYSAVPNGGYFGSAPNQGGANGVVARTGLPNGLIQPPRIKSDYPVTYWGDVHIATTGLKNLGNTCYMNATIQCLSATVPFARFFNDGRWRNAINYTNGMGTKGAFASAFSVILHQLWHGDLPYITPVEFRKSMGSHKSLYATSDQQDSQEFLSFLLDGIHEDLNRVISKPNWTKTPAQEAELETLLPQIASEQEWMLWQTRNDSIIVDFFQGQLRNRLKCSSCGQTSTTYNAFSLLQLPIPPTRSGKVPLRRCFEAYCNKEIMEGDDAWDCPKCKTKRKATKELSLSRLPPILIIHLKRFESNGRFSDKMDTLVDFPLKSLDLTDFMPGPLPAGADKRTMNVISPEDPRTQMPPYRYDLYGVTNHYGNLTSGHYTAFVASRGQWKLCDDSAVKDVDPKQVVNQRAYVLFYKRVKV